MIYSNCCGAADGQDGNNLVTTEGWISRICEKCAKEMNRKIEKGKIKIYKVKIIKIFKKKV